MSGAASMLAAMLQIAAIGLAAMAGVHADAAAFNPVAERAFQRLMIAALCLSTAAFALLVLT